MSAALPENCEKNLTPRPTSLLTPLHFSKPPLLDEEKKATDRFLNPHGSRHSVRRRGSHARRDKWATGEGRLDRESSDLKMGRGCGGVAAASVAML
jgi:hypothetical protein